MDGTLDVKTPRGFIPPLPATRSSATASHGFFKVFLFVEDEEMIPLAIEKPQDILTIQRFVAIPGKAFSCRIELSRPPPQGVLYGCRVYVDRGGLDHRHVFDVAKGASEEQTADGKSIDDSEPDHFFWIGPRETSYTVRGYYCSSDEEYEFTFSDLPRNNDSWHSGDEKELEKQANQIGVIRFQFSKVKEMVKRSDKGRFGLPSRPTDYSNGILYKKGVHLSTRPGKRLKTGGVPDEIAVLEQEICYESRVYFNDRVGYQDRASAKGLPVIYSIFQEPSCLRALPLTEFGTTRENRKIYIDKFLAWLQEKRFTRVEDELVAQVSMEGPKTNDTVATEDLVHFINATISPAAAYVVCTGQVRPGNFGEKLVQRRSVTREERDAHFPEKEKALVSFFAADPGNYELIENGRDKENRLLYAVKKASIVIIDDSDQILTSSAYPNRLGSWV